MMARELDSVVLNVDVPGHALKQGDVGTVVLVHGTHGYEIEFMTLDGEALAVVSLTTGDVHTVGGWREIAHARFV